MHSFYILETGILIQCFAMKSDPQIPDLCHSGALFDVGNVSIEFFDKKLIGIRNLGGEPFPPYSLRKLPFDIWIVGKEGSLNKLPLKG